MNKEITAGGFTILVEGVDYHRNGVGGNGFHVVAFRWAEDGDEPRAMLGIVFDGQCRVAVLDREQARIGNIFMHPNDTHAGCNAWRGDNFQPVLMLAIDGYYDALDPAKPAKVGAAS
jgi:hypothetical protein